MKTENKPTIVEYYEEKIMQINFKQVTQLPEDIFKIFKVDE